MKYYVTVTYDQYDFVYNNLKTTAVFWECKLPKCRCQTQITPVFK